MVLLLSMMKAGAPLKLQMWLGLCPKRHALVLRFDEHLICRPAPSALFVLIPSHTNNNLHLHFSRRVFLLSWVNNTWQESFQMATSFTVLVAGENWNSVESGFAQPAEWNRSVHASGGRIGCVEWSDEELSFFLKSEKQITCFIFHFTIVNIKFKVRLLAYPMTIGLWKMNYFETFVLIMLQVMQNLHTAP